MPIATAALILSFGFQTPKVDLSTPKKAALSFCASIQDRRWNDAALCVSGGSVAKAQSLIASFPKGGSMKMELRQLTSETQAESATVTGQLSYSMTIPGQPRMDKVYSETLEFKRTGAKWLIVGNSRLITDASTTPLAGIAAIFAHGMPKPRTVPPTTNASPAAKTLSNLKMIAVATMIYAADYDDLLPRSDWQKALNPYLKDLSAYKSPVSTAAKPSPYSFNSALYGRNLAKLAKPATLVLVYEGKGNILAYPYSGQGAVAFADGKARLVTKAEGAKLRWAP